MIFINTFGVWAVTILFAIIIMNSIELMKRRLGLSLSVWTLMEVALLRQLSYRSC